MDQGVIANLGFGYVFDAGLAQDAAKVNSWPFSGCWPGKFQ